MTAAAPSAPARRRLARLPDDVARSARALLLAGLGFPASRLRLPYGIDYEVRVRLRLHAAGDRPEISGLASETARSPGWRRIDGYATAAGSFLHVVPSSGEMGILLPPGAEPLERGGGLVFVRERVPRGGRLGAAGPGITADEALGRFAALCALRGEADGRRVLIRASGKWTVPAILGALDGCSGIHRADPVPGGVLVVPGLRLPPAFLEQGADMAAWAPAFQRGVAEVLEAGLPDFRSASRMVAAVRLAAGAGMRWRLVAGGRLSLRPPLAEPAMPVKCRVGRVMLPFRASWPTCAEPAVHPSGLVYRLRPDEGKAPVCVRPGDML